MKSYLTRRRQRVRVNSNFWERIISGVPHSSILGLLLFKILNDLFLFAENSDLSNYADDNTLYNCGNNLEEKKQTLKEDSQVVTKWFYENYIALNSGKCHLMCLGKNTENETYFFNNTEMKNNSGVKILGVTINNNLEFRRQIKNSCRYGLCHV